MIGFVAMFFSCSVKERSDKGFAEEKKEPAMVDIKLESDSLNEFSEILWRQADSIVGSMSIEEKIGQCLMPSMMTSIDNASVNRINKYIHDYKVGGILLLKGDSESAAIISEVGGYAQIPLFIAIDAEWGLGMRLEDAPKFPKNRDLGKNVDETLMFDYGMEVARECRRIGINMVLGPVIDVTDNSFGIIGKRSFGGDPSRVAELGIAYAMGLESGGIISVAKHFPGHGSSGVDSHRKTPVITRSLHQLDSIDILPFKKYIDSGLSAVMVGHLALPAVDPEGKPSAVSSPVIKELLQEDLGFKGLVLTDALNMGGVTGYSAADALAAGADIVISPADTEKEIEIIRKRLDNQEITYPDINQKCKKIIFYKLLSGLDNNENIKRENIIEDLSRESENLKLRLNGEGEKAL